MDSVCSWYGSWLIKSFTLFFICIFILIPGFNNSVAVMCKLNHLLLTEPQSFLMVFSTLNCVNKPINHKVKKQNYLMQLAMVLLPWSSCCTTFTLGSGETLWLIFFSKHGNARQSIRKQKLAHCFGFVFSESPNQPIEQKSISMWANRVAHIETESGGVVPTKVITLSRL